MIREPNGTTDIFTQNKQPRPIVNGRTSFGVRAEFLGGK